VALEHPAKAAAMNEWSPAMKDGLLLHLANTVRQGAPPASVVLWQVKKGDRELCCVTRYLPTGIDVRLLEGIDFKRTQLCRDAPAVEALAEAWRTALIDRGWQQA